MSSETVTVRTTFALARDGGLPLSSYLRRIHPVSKTPIWAVFVVFCTSTVLLLLQLVSSTAFVAVTSISTIGYQISYAVPIILRHTYYRDKFVPAHFSLGRWGPLCGAMAGTFLTGTSVMFTLPTVYPVTMENFNYTIVVLAGALCAAGIYWIGYARHTFKGPGPRYD
jgi:amino acid transporter